MVRRDTPKFHAPCPIAVLRIDCDWYASTKTCLKTLFGHVAAEGIVIADGYPDWDGHARASHEHLASYEGVARLKTFNGKLYYVCKRRTKVANLKRTGRGVSRRRPQIAISVAQNRRLVHLKFGPDPIGTITDGQTPAIIARIPHLPSWPNHFSKQFVVSLRPGAVTGEGGQRMWGSLSIASEIDCKSSSSLTDMGTPVMSEGKTEYWLIPILGMPNFPANQRKPLF